MNEFSSFGNLIKRAQEETYQWPLEHETTGSSASSSGESLQDLIKKIDEAKARMEAACEKYPDIWLITQQERDEIEERTGDQLPGSPIQPFGSLYGVPFEVHPDKLAVFNRALELREEGKFKRIGIIGEREQKV